MVYTGLDYNGIKDLHEYSKNSAANLEDSNLMYGFDYYLMADATSMLQYM